MPTFNPTSVTPDGHEDENITRGEEQTTPASPQPSDEKPTYTQVEITDPDLIDITISDEKTPIVVLFGPPQCGKTMVMLRLAEYLNNSSSAGYTLDPVRDYRPSTTNYKEICDNFKNRLNSKWAADKNTGMDFLLLKIYYKGSPVVQILEAPGESYYDPNNPDVHRDDFRPYVQQTIINSKNPKLWVFFTEPNWMEQPVRQDYVKKLNIPYLKSHTDGNKKVIVLMNKIDTTPLFNGGNVNVQSAIEYVDGQYPGLFDTYINTHPISSLWRKHNCTFIPFQTGTYTQVTDPLDNRVKTRYVPGIDYYPANLWASILKLLGIN